MSMRYFCISFLIDLQKNVTSYFHFVIMVYCVCVCVCVYMGEREKIHVIHFEFKPVTQQINVEQVKEYEYFLEALCALIC